MKRLLFLLPAFLAFQVSASPALAWTWPVDGPVLRQFQLGNDPYASGQHRGVDIQTRDGANVLAPASGRVTFSGTVPSGGRTLTIETSSGYAVTLLHLGAISARKGESLVEGAVIGFAGRSGVPEHDAVYIHLGIRMSSDRHGYLDPLSFLPARTNEAPSVPAANEHDDGSHTPVSVDEESEGHERADVPLRESASADPQPVAASSASLPIEALPTSAVPAVDAGVSAAPAEQESEVATPQSGAGVQEDSLEVPEIEDSKTADLPAPRPPDQRPKLSVEPGLSDTVPATATVPGGGDQVDKVAVDLPTSPETPLEHGVTSADSRPARPSGETEPVPLSAGPVSRGETVTGSVPATDRETGNVVPVDGDVSAATEGAVELDSPRVDPVPDPVSVSLPSGEHSGASTRAEEIADAGAKSQGRARSDGDRQGESVDRSAVESASKQGLSSLDSDGGEQASVVGAAVVPPGRPVVSSSHEATLGTVAEAKPVHLPEPVAPAALAQPVNSLGPVQSVAEGAAPDEVSQSSVTIAYALGAATVASVLVASAAAALSLFRRRSLSARAGEPTRLVASRSVREIESGLPELSESDRVALDVELDEILVSPSSTERSSRATELALRR